MNYPERPTCHDLSPSPFVTRDIVWRPAETEPRYGRQVTYRTCSYCGSMHPEDLVGLLRLGARASMADWKYGWPHKLYIDGIPNPIAGREVEVGTRSYPGDDGKLVVEPIMGKASEGMQGKFYSEHLKDAGFDEEARELVMRAIYVHTGVQFRLDGRGLHYYCGPRGEK